MFNLFYVAGLIAIILIFMAMWLLLSGDGSREQKLMVCFLCGSFIQNAGYLLELRAVSLDAVLEAVKVQYLGSVFVPLLYCCFLYSYCYQKVPPVFVKLVALVDVIVLVSVFTCDLHTLYYRSYEWVRGQDGHYYVQIFRGPIYYAFLIFGCIIPFVQSIYILLRTIRTVPDHKAGKQYRTMMILSCLPLLAMILYTSNLTHGYDPTPATMGFMLAVVEILIWSRRNYDFRHLAAAAVLNSMSGGVVALDDKRRIVSYNHAAEGIFPELTPQILGDSVEKIKAFDASMLSEDGKSPFSIGDRYYESQSKKIFNHQGLFEGYVVLVLDVTDTRNYIEEIKHVRELAEQASTAKSQFLANMSHEIRTPMNAIIGLSDILIEESRGRKLYGYARDIKSAAQNLLAIINDILDLSKVEAGKMELVMEDYYIKAAVGEVVAMMDIAASQRGLLMKYEYDPSIPCRYHGDVGRIKQILINLLNNALKFTQRGYVKITISGTAGAVESEELVTFRVQDTGCGIRKEDQEKIFENFQQLDAQKNRTVEGTGLGLSITNRLVQLMGGTISLESVYGEGSTFTVTIPQKVVDMRTLEEMPEVPAAEEVRTQMFTAVGFKVLLVDDNLVNRKVAKRLLENYKFELMEAASGPEAIELVKKKCYDLIFMDHMMPEMDGIETVEIIRTECGENGAKPIIIALTANAMVGIRERFLASGFQDFIPKPLDRKDLNRTLARWVPEELKCYTAKCEDDEEEACDVEDLEIWGIDTDAIIGQYPRMEDYVEILNLYCMDSKRKLVVLRELIEKKDFKGYEIEVHALKSASANIGAMELSDLAKEHELAAMRGNETFVLRNFEELRLIYAKQVEYIEKFLKERDGEAAKPGGELPDIEKEVLHQKIEEALGYLESFKSRECETVIEELCHYRLDIDVEAKMKEIQRQLKLYEDDRAEELLRELLKYLGKED